MPFRSGIEVLLTDAIEVLRGRNLGLLSHSAAVDACGRSSAQLLVEAGLKLRMLFGPEHGYFGQALAGERVISRKHPSWNVPIVSLYGSRRSPPLSSLRKIEILLIDLQDLGVRAYTYVSTMVMALRAACRTGIRVIIADRPIPFGTIVDGPMLDPHFKSFVGWIETPFVYGMTPAETAIWFKQYLPADSDVIAAPMRGWNRTIFPPDPSRPWIPPSPGIRSKESALCYPTTVFGEAISSIDIGRGSALPFQLLGTPWTNSRQLLEHLNDEEIPGITFSPCAYCACSGHYEGQLLDGVHMVVTNPLIYKPALATMSIISAFQKIRGIDRFWRDKRIRVDFFDKLIGTNSVRSALMNGEKPATIARGWHEKMEPFLISRRAALLY